MVFSKPIIPFATMLLAAHMVVAGVSSDPSAEDLTFAKAPAYRGPEVSSWLADKTARPTTKPATKTSTKAPTRRTAEAELKLEVDDVEGKYPISVVAVPTTIPIAELAVPINEQSSNEEDADSSVEEVSQLYARFLEEPSSRSGRIIAKSRIAVEDASPFLDEPEDPEDGSWGKRDRPAGSNGNAGGQGKPAVQGQAYGGGQGKPAAQGQGYGGHQGQGMGLSGKQGAGMGQGKPLQKEGGGWAGQQDYGHNMKRSAPYHGPRNGTATDYPQRPNFAPSGVKPSGPKPTGSKPAGAGYGNGGKGPRPTATK